MPAVKHLAQLTRRVALRNIDVRVVEVSMVQRVKCVDTQVEAEPLADVNILRDRGIKIHRAWADDHTSSRTSDGEGGGIYEGVDVEPSLGRLRSDGGNAGDAVNSGT